MTCPGCKGDLLSETVGGLNLDVCPKCAGVWFDEGELRRFVELDGATVQEFSQEHQSEVSDCSRFGRLCPKCEIGLESYHYAYNSPFVIDSCPKCNGIFVDQSEIIGIEQFQEQARNPDHKQEAALEIASLEFGIVKSKDRAARIARSVWIRRSTGSHSWWQWGLDENLRF